jgi:hypothetical protein
VRKGLATFKAGPGADGARVLLDGRLVPELPATIEVPAGKQLTLVASKQGFSTYKRMVSFDDGVAEKTFEIRSEGVAPLNITNIQIRCPVFTVLDNLGYGTDGSDPRSLILLRFADGVDGFGGAEEDLATKCARLGIAWTIFRPTLIYGCASDKNVTTIANFVRRFGFFPAVGRATGKRQPVHADDLAQACVTAIDCAATFEASLGSFARS